MRYDRQWYLWEKQVMRNRTVREKVICAVFGTAFMIVAASPIIAGEDTALQKSPKRITLVYETTHNPPQALGRGTAIDRKKPGLTLELLRLVGERLGIEFTYKRMPWKRGLYLLEKNEVDGIFHASYKKEREAVGVYPKLDGKPDESRAIFFQSYVLYKPKGSLIEFDGKEITNADGDIGVISNYAIADDLRQKGYEIKESKTQKINFDKLAKGRIVAFAMLENMGDDYLIRNSDIYTNIVKVQPPLSTKAYHLLFSHGFMEENRDLAARIWDTIAEIKGSDAFKVIIEKY
jgi:polar amino acid transport system substrate-binding protein